ncbi:MAG: glycoside hydrolase family 3 protein, partial [Erysipelotrichaceae bacterium]|nr:glycoside hydrolase family 3 protein [Erysipelotrichaceae bacterium]
MKTAKTFKTILLILLACLILTACAPRTDNRDDPADRKYQKYAAMTAEEIVSSLTLEQKAMQMVQPACYSTSLKQMKENCYGSILSRNFYYNAEQWRQYVNSFQEMAVSSQAGIPFIYGQDDVHGVNYALDTVIFPHNIGLGAADDEQLMYQIGQITADEAKMCSMLWNFAPCLAQSSDPRWGRTYESYGSDLEVIKRLSTAYTRGLQDNGIIACAKHFLGDGNVVFGTGEAGMLIDRGDAILTEQQISELLAVYQAQIDAGVKTIMISHSSLNGIKMHENAKYISLLKNEMGFEGFIVSDWNSIQNTSLPTYYQQVVTAINAGIDMLMEVDRYDEAAAIIVEAAEKGDISRQRIDDAVRRIIQVKIDIGVIADPFGEKL